MIILIVIIIVLYFIFNSGGDSSSEEITKNLDHNSNSRRPKNIAVEDFIVSDIIKRKGIDYEITKITNGSDPNLLIIDLKKLQDCTTLKLAFTKTKKYTLINGVYIRRDNTVNSYHSKKEQIHSGAENFQNSGIVNRVDLDVKNDIKIDRRSPNHNQEEINYIKLDKVKKPIQQKSKSKTNQAFSPKTISNNEVIKGRLTVSSVNIAENAILNTFNNNLLNTPYQIKLETSRRKNPSFGNYWDYKVVEINTGFVGIINQEEMLDAMNKFNKDYFEMGLNIFGKKKEFHPSDKTNFQKFINSNIDYYVDLVVSAGKYNPEFEDVINVALGEVITLMTETIAIFIDERLTNSLINKAKR
ncbi:hypothetical protein D1953_00205 [Peribacillus asahii]|uniref:Uncharacterized protein n=1 Tax=Peribacillus asahii TaxID=228899 RepID=A0A398BFK2_9BACI|nr:hypothetical protein [Peribacillus asahii]RID89035.1 hypothetical protein D1953_00205 [Peribacillus asahii]